MATANRTIQLPLSAEEALLLRAFRMLDQELQTSTRRLVYKMVNAAVDAAAAASDFNESEKVVPITKNLCGPCREAQ